MSASPRRILHLEDDANDAYLIQRILQQAGIDAIVVLVDGAEKFRAAVEAIKFDLILSDSGVPGLSSAAALETARKYHPSVPFLCVSSRPNHETISALLSAGADGVIQKEDREAFVATVRRILVPDLHAPLPPAPPADSEKLPLAAPSGALPPQVHCLVSAVQQLASARSLTDIQDIVRHTARELVGSDGATFVLRDGNQCHYVDEDAISPLWKGHKFPIHSCISGWSMLHRLPAVIPDIYADPRIPHEAYRPTFVRSLVMVPIRSRDPIGAIGNYWAHPHQATLAEVELLQSLADSAAVAMEKIRIYAELERRVRDRTAQLEAANHELEAFSYSVSHDLRAPLNVLEGYAHLLQDDYAGALDPSFRAYVDRIRQETQRMLVLIDDLMRLSQLTRQELKRSAIDLEPIALACIAHLRGEHPDRAVDFSVSGDLKTEGDPGLLRVALTNLLQNAWKYTGRVKRAQITFGRTIHADGHAAFFVRDNGAGFDQRHASRLFAPFQRLHRQEEFPGSGVGLATVQRIIHKHGGRLWAEATPGNGATFYFTLPEAGAH